MKCELCNTDKNLIKHHIDYEKELTVTLCNNCHGIVHSDKQHSFYPKNDKSHSLEKSVTFTIVVEPGQLKQLRSINRKLSTSMLVRQAIDFYLDNGGVTTKSIWEQEYTKLLSSHIKLEHEYANLLSSHIELNERLLDYAQLQK